MSGVCLVTKGYVCGSSSALSIRVVCPLSATLRIKDSLNGKLKVKDNLKGVVKVCGGTP